MCKPKRQTIMNQATNRMVFQPRVDLHGRNVFLICIHEEYAAGQKERSYTREKIIYMEAGPTHFMLIADSNFKGYSYQTA